MCHLQKKRDQSICRNYRGITLLSLVYQISSVVLIKRLTVYAEEILDQGRFRSRIIHQSPERCFEYNIDLYFLFIDFKQAFHSINRRQLFAALKTFGIPEKLIRLVEKSLKGSKGIIAVGQSKSREIHIKSGIRQVDALSAVASPTLCH